MDYLLAILLTVGVAGAYEIAKPGCPDECGGVKIPFPFGLAEGCYFDDITMPSNTTYRISCDNSTNPPVPFLDKDVFWRAGRLSIPVLSITLDDHTLRLPSSVAYECYTFYPNRRVTFPTSTDNNTHNLGSIYPFNISSSRNRFVAVGCDTTAQVWDDLDQGLWRDAAGCTTSCASLQEVRNGSCSSGGCCETSISDSMIDPWIQVGSFTNHSEVSYFNPCSYAFVGEAGSYDFSVANLTATPEDVDKMRVPVVYDWSIAIGNNCSQAMSSGNGSLICGPNTHCVDVYYSVVGYRCQCFQGYAGNPYLEQGCQDINECVNKRLNDCEKQEYCVNKMGGYDCRCPKGHQGNGTLISPCIPAPGAAKLFLGLGIGMGSMIGVMVIYLLFKLLKRRKEIQERQKYFKKNGGLLLHQEMSTSEGSIDRTRIFSQSELERATDNFNDNRVLGRGGQGTVYKGMLVDGTIIAVKKSKKVDENQLGQFINEVVILSQINHRNIVKLFGCCLETEVPLLVYEFVPNGTLYQHIHHPSEDFLMTWKIRFQIAVECARAIAYLHSSCSSPIHHRDIKSSNILLDEKYKAKVSDFGTSRSVSIDKTHVTTCVQGTFGYLDPEFFRSSQFTEKSDVYSFGVVLLELLTSMKPIFTSTSGEPRGLATEFIQIMETSPDQLDNILDTQVLRNCSKEEIETLAKLVERCLNMNAKKRPTMSEVAITLEMIKKQQDEVGNPTIEQGITRQGHRSLCMDNMSLPCSNPSTSTITDSSYSMEVEPLLFDSM